MPGINKVFERQVWRVQVAHLHKAGRASPSVDDKLKTLTMLWRNLSLIRGETHKKLMSICFFDNKTRNWSNTRKKWNFWKASLTSVAHLHKAARACPSFFKFYPSVLLSMIETSQSLREKLDSYCKIIYLMNHFIFIYFIFCLYIIYGFSLHILQQIYLKCFSLITKV